MLSEAILTWDLSFTLTVPSPPSIHTSIQKLHFSCSVLNWYIQTLVSQLKCLITCVELFHTALEGLPLARVPTTTFHPSAYLIATSAASYASLPYQHGLLSLFRSEAELWLTTTPHRPWWLHINSSASSAVCWSR